MSRTTTLAEAKVNLRALIQEVRAGETILILDRGLPVARIAPVGAYSDPSGRLERLERAGAFRIGAAAPPLDLLHCPGPPVALATSAVQKVVDERRFGR